MTTKKIFIIAGGITVVGLVLLYFYYRSQNKIMKGQEYNLAGADIYGLSGTNTQATPGTNASGAPVTTYTAPRFAVDSNTEPAASLIAQTVDTFQKSANTMNRIKTRIGWNSNLFRGLTSAETVRIKNAFRAKFDINPESLLSYPIWNTYESPTLLGTLRARKNWATYNTLRGGSMQQVGTREWWFNVPEWFNFASYGFDVNDPRDFSILIKFFTNAVASIEDLMFQTRNEAAQFLRQQGWRFTDYGDIN